MEDKQQTEPVIEQPAAPAATVKEDGIKIPTPIIRWVLYINYFLLLLLPAFIWGPLTVGPYISLSFILAQFAGQLNKLIDK